MTIKQLSLSVSLNQIWVIVWAVAGFVALVAGIAWGARLGVQFSLSLIASKHYLFLFWVASLQCPGRLLVELHWSRRKNFRNLRRPMLGGAIEEWFAYVVALVFLIFRPQGLLAKKLSRGSNNVLQRTGLYRTSYRQDQSLFNLPTDRNALIVILVGLACPCWELNTG